MNQRNKIVIVEPLKGQIMKWPIAIKFYFFDSLFFDELEL
jgi:hypothetical protein